MPPGKKIQWPLEGVSDQPQSHGVKLEAVAWVIKVSEPSHVQVGIEGAEWGSEAGKTF